jgi:hypothetical protein
MHPSLFGAHILIDKLKAGANVRNTINIIKEIINLIQDNHQK